MDNDEVAHINLLGQRKTDTKSNEITAIPELLRLLDIRTQQGYDGLPAC